MNCMKNQLVSSVPASVLSPHDKVVAWPLGGLSGGDCAGDDSCLLLLANYPTDILTLLTQGWTSIK